jgi:hypothetical protein
MSTSRCFLGDVYALRRPTLPRTAIDNIRVGGGASASNMPMVVIDFWHCGSKFEFA